MVYHTLVLPMPWIVVFKARITPSIMVLYTLYFIREIWYQTTGFLTLQDNTPAPQSGAVYTVGTRGVGSLIEEEGIIF